MAESQEIQEKLKNMSPEELAEFQKQNCIFCQIIAGKVPSRKVYEDDKVVAILDIHPANPGHLLVLPKQHFAVMPQLPPEILQHCFVVVKLLSQAVLQALNVQGTNIFVASGAAGGQRAPHFIVNIVPRRDGDNLNLAIPEHQINGADIAKIRSLLKPVVAKVFGSEEMAKEKAEQSEKSVDAEKGAEGAEKKGKALDLDNIAELLSK